MSIDWSKLNDDQRRAVTALVRDGDLERYWRLEHEKALVVAKATGVSWKVLGAAMGISHETVRYRHKIATQDSDSEKIS